MIEVPIQAIPNQTFSITLDQINYDISINATNRATNSILTGIMAVTIVRDGTTIVSGQRAIFGYPIIPYRYLESGNFAFVTMNDEYPDYNFFGITQTLVYFSSSDLATLRAGT